MDQFHLVKNYNEGRLLSEVHEAVSGWLEQHRTAMWDSMEPTDRRDHLLTGGPPESLVATTSWRYMAGKIS